MKVLNNVTTIALSLLTFFIIVILSISIKMHYKLAELEKIDTDNNVKMTIKAQKICGKNMATKMVDVHGNPVYVERMDGSNLGIEILCIDKSGIVIKATTDSGAVYP